MQTFEDEELQMMNVLSELDNILYSPEIKLSINSQNNKVLNEYEIKEKISRGLIWKVKKVMRNNNEQKKTIFDNQMKTYALKKTHVKTQIKRRYYYDEEKQENLNYFHKVINEIEIYSKIKHNINISRLYEVIYNPENDKFIYLIMELGDLDTIMLRDEEYNYRHNRKLVNYIYSKYKNELFCDFENYNELYSTNCNNEKESLIEHGVLKYEIKKILAKFLFKQIINGIIFLHSLKISHRDIKPDNIVFSSIDDNCKIIDFSISVNFKENKKDYYTDEPGGSIHFQSPEQFESSIHDPFISDIWSMGVTLYIFICERFPFDSDSEIELQIKISEDPITFPDYVDDKIKDLILDILEKRPNKRSSLLDILNKLSEI